MEVLFYQLKDEAKLADFRLKLCAKIWRSTASVSVVAPADQLEALDQALWSLPGFVAHQIGVNAEQPSALQLVTSTEGVQSKNVLNLTDQSLTLPPSCERLIEVFSESTKVNARTKYQTYRQQGHPLKHHHV